SDWRQSENNDELALLNEELMLLIADGSFDKALPIEDAQASQGHAAKMAGNADKYKLLSGAAIIIAGTFLFTPDYALADDQDLAAENARLRQEFEAARRETQSLIKTLK